MYNFNNDRFDLIYLLKIVIKKKISLSPHM